LASSHQESNTRFPEKSYGYETVETFPFETSKSANWKFFSANGFKNEVKINFHLENLHKKIASYMNSDFLPIEAQTL
jgi:hypothetical protein